jgi:replicative DNA helicase
LDTQRACISKIVIDGTILPFIEQKISKDFFTDEHHLQVWDFIFDHYRQYGKTPDTASVHKAYPNYELPDFPEPVEYYLNQLKQDRKKVILTTSVQEYADRLIKDDGSHIGDELETILRKGMAQAAHEISQGRDSDFFLGWDRVMERLRERKANPGIRGVSTGFPSMDHLTGGLQDEQLVTYIGTPKAGKSSVLLKMALNAHRNGIEVLFVTFEMSTREQEDRLVSLLSGVALTDILNGTFTDAEEKSIEKALSLRKSMSGFTITSDITSAITVSGVQAKVQQYQPGLVVVDGAYLMDDEYGETKGSPQALTNITRGFKRMAQTVQKPVVISTQALLARSRGGLRLDSIGYSSSFAQDSDIIFGVEKDEMIPNVSLFKVLAARSSPVGQTLIRFDWTQGLIEELTSADYEAALNNLAPGAAVSGRGGRKAGATTGLMAEWDDDAA